MKMGIGIGWPNASASSTPVELAYFQVDYFCDNSVHKTGCTQLIDTSIYRPGDYVFCTTPNVLVRVELGSITIEPFGATYNVNGPVYNSCSL